MTFIVGSLFLTVSVLLMCSSIVFQQTVNSILICVLSSPLGLCTLFGCLVSTWQKIKLTTENFVN